MAACGSVHAHLDSALHVLLPSGAHSVPCLRLRAPSTCALAMARAALRSDCAPQVDAASFRPTLQPRVLTKIDAIIARDTSLAESIEGEARSLVAGCFVVATHACVAHDAAGMLTGWRRARGSRCCYAGTLRLLRLHSSCRCHHGPPRGHLCSTLPPIHLLPLCQLI